MNGPGVARKKKPQDSPAEVARKRTPAKLRKSVMLRVLVTKDERVTFAEAAKRADRTLSAWIRAAALKAAESKD